MSNSNQQTKAEFVLPSKNLSDDINFFTKKIGMRLDEIFPADDPSVAVISGFGLRLRIDKGSDEPGWYYSYINRRHCSIFCS